MAESQQQVRQPRFQRHRHRKPAMVLQERDTAIVRLVADYRIISSEEIQALIPGSHQSILRRLQKLYHAGYLDRPRHQKLLPNRRMIYALGQYGAQLLAQGKERDFVPPRDISERNRELKLGFLDHALMISRFRAVLELACRGRDDVRLESWRQDDEIRDSVQADLPEGPARIPVCPDAWFVLALPKEPAGSNRINVFFEADRSTMSLKRFLTKMRGYWHYRQSGQQTDRFGFRNFLVLTLAPSAERAENLRQITEQVDESQHTSRRMFLFGAQDLCTLAEPSRVLGPVWTTPASRERHSLLE
jgi:hypothetical protein